MTDTLREQVSNEIAAYYADTNARRTMGCADAAIAVVIEELAQRAENEDQFYGQHVVVNWLRAQKETTHE